MESKGENEQHKHWVSIRADCDTADSKIPSSKSVLLITAGLIM